MSKEAEWLRTFKTEQSVREKEKIVEAEATPQEDEVVDCLLACNKCNRDLRQIKVFMNKEMTDIDASFEFSYTSDEELKEQLNHALFMIGYVRRGFMDALEELHEGGSDDDSSEIEEIQEDDND